MNKDIDAIRGDTLTIQFDIDSNTTLDLSSNEFNVTFSVKQTPTSTGYVFQKTKASVSELSRNSFVLRVAPEDTVNLATGFYFYDLQLEIYDDVFTVAIGRLHLDADITRPEIEYPPFPYPDIDGDDIVTLNDSTLISAAYSNIMAGLPSGLTPVQENKADCNRDGHIDMIDASLVMLFINQCEQGTYTNDSYGWASFMTQHYIPQG